MACHGPAVFEAEAVGSGEGVEELLEAQAEALGWQGLAELGGVRVVDEDGGRLKQVGRGTRRPPKAVLYASPGVA